MAKYTQQGMFDKLSEFSNSRKNKTTLKKYNGGGENSCEPFYKWDSTLNKCVPFTEEEKANYSLQYMRDWTNSPMHKEMLTASVIKDAPLGDINKYVDNITNLRLKALNSNIRIEDVDPKQKGVIGEAAPLGSDPYINNVPVIIRNGNKQTINPKVSTEDDIKNYNTFRSPLYYSQLNNAKFKDATFENFAKDFKSDATFYTRNRPGEHAYVYPHEFSHLSDLGGDLIPISDRNLIKQWQLHYPDYPAAYDKYVLGDARSLGDQYTNKIITKDEYDKRTKDLKTDWYLNNKDKRYYSDKEMYENNFNKFKKQGDYNDDTLTNDLPYDDFIRKNKINFDPVDYKRYVGTNSEVRARVNAIRMYGKAAGIYDPFTEKLTPEKYKELNKLFENQNLNEKDANQLRQLQHLYNDDEILNLINTLSKNNSEVENDIQYGKTGGSSKQKIIFSPMEGGCPDGQYWTGSECKPIPSGTKIVYSQEELDKLNISKKEQQRLYNDYLLRKRNQATIEAARRKKYGPMPSGEKFYKTFEDIPTHGFIPIMSYGPSSLTPDGLGPGIPSIKENMVDFKTYKKMLDKSSVKPIGYKGHPGGGHFYPIYEKPSNYILGYNREEEEIEKIPEEIEIPPISKLEHGPLPELQPGNYFSEPLPEAPQYELEPYTDERLRLSIEPGKTKSKKHTKRLFGHGQKYSWHTYKPTKDLEFGKKEVTKPIAALVQKLTGYDPKYFEGYYDEEGNYIPGELEIANELGNKVEFRGAASLRDYINQQKYAKEYDEYQKKLDEWDERYEQSKAEHPLFKYIKGGTTCPEGFEYINGQCVPIVNDCEDEQCRETDQIQEIYNNALDIPRRVVDYEFGIEDLTNQKYAGNARLAWKSQGVKSFVEPSCMYVAGLGWRCAPATKEYMSHFDPVNFNSNIGFIHAVDRGDLPFTRVGKFSDKNFDDQSKGNMRIGDVVNFKGADNSHGETFVGYKEDGTPMYIDSNGNPSNYSTHSLWTPLRPNTTGKGRDYAYVNRFDTERYINDVHGDEIQALEEKARTNPTMIYKDEDLPYLKTLPVQPLEHNFQVGDVIKQKGGLSTSGMMGVRPNPMVASDQAIGAYYNMRPSQVDAEINQMIQENPELQFIPRERLRRGTSPGFIGADSRIYSDPTTIEGSARNYENYIEAGNPSIFPMRKFGGQMTEEKITILNKFFR